jgi:dTDP-4-dehydrorhamnose reductase
MRPVLITGAGTLGTAFQLLCGMRGIECRLTNRAELDITHGDSLTAALDRYEPWLVINAAGYVRVDDAEHEVAHCHRANVHGPETLARACARDDVPLITFSSDLVFDGRKASPYDETDAPAPLNVYGRTKLEAEQRVLGHHPASLVVRTSAFFGPWDSHNFVTRVAHALAAGRTLRAAADLTVSPTYVPDLVHACLDLAIDGESGLWHLANAGSTTWADLARDVARLHDHPVDAVIDVPARELGWRARRPVFSALHSTRGTLLPSLDHALERYLGERRKPP